MAKKSIFTEAQNSISDAAKTGADFVKPVANAALGAAAAAAAGVVLDSMSNALKRGGQKLERATPGATEAVRLAATPLTRRRPKKKASAKKKAAAKKAAATKKRPAAKKKRGPKKAAKKAVKKQRSKARRRR